LELVNKTLKDTLNEAQNRRLQQLEIQRQAMFGLAEALDMEIAAKALKLSDAQKKRIVEIVRHTNGLQGLMYRFVRHTNGLVFLSPLLMAESRDDIKKELRTRMEERILNVLDDEQRAKWKELLGEKFKGQFPL